MNEHTGFLVGLTEKVDRYLSQHSWLRWLARQMVPNIGTLLMVVVLLLTIPSLAAPLIVPSATSTSLISYQGRLTDSDGTPLTGDYNLEFCIYEEQAGGESLWKESQTVNVSDGLFSVMLGSTDNTLAKSIEGYDELYLGITVDTDSEMAPRVQLGSVPFSMQAMTVPDGSITTLKIASEAITTIHILDEAVTREKITTEAITTTHILDGAINQAKAPFALGGPDNNYRVEAGTATTHGNGYVTVAFLQSFNGPPIVLASAYSPQGFEGFRGVHIMDISTAGFEGRCWYWQEENKIIWPGEMSITWIAIGN